MKMLNRLQGFLTRKYFAVPAMMMIFLLPARPLAAQEKVTKEAKVELISVASAENPRQTWTLVIHGGAGGPGKGTMSEETEKGYLGKMDEALSLGAKILEGGGSSLDAVETVVKFMEDCPLFNAGKGAVLNEYGKAELDASIMDGSTGMAGAVAGVTTIKNPVAAARLVMDKTSHVMLVGRGAESFAKKMGLKPVDSAYFITPERLASWKKWKSSPSGSNGSQAEKEKHGTVGAVALDQKGNLAAATSTGGQMGKMAGRVGDSPIIGAGTYASNNTCAVSATGQGEFFIRNVIAYDLSALMEYRGMTVEEAGKLLIAEKLTKQKAAGGLIAVDKDGNIAMPFNTSSMYRGFTKSTGEHEVAIY
ncbi:MAG: isoaspartyl peptidase/L-asparaginase [Bacteroidetes bacterium]|nr:isoaspartyl peptidase/L-asparaginase [Bacteroidota bacterium]